MYNHAEMTKTQLSVVCIHSFIKMSTFDFEFYKANVYLHGFTASNHHIFSSRAPPSGSMNTLRDACIGRHWESLP